MTLTAPRAWIALAGTAAALALGGILALLVPSDRWGPEALAGTATLLLSIALPGLMPLPRSRGRTDDGSIVLIGPLGLLLAGLLLLGIISAGLGLTQTGPLPWVAVLVWTAALVVGWLLLRAMTRIAEEAAPQPRNAPQDARTRWTTRLAELAILCDEPVGRQQLEALAERARLASNDVPGQAPPPQNEVIDATLERLAASPATPADELFLAVRRIEQLLQLRDEVLRAARSKSVA